MSALKLRAIGNSVGVVLPMEILARLRVFAEFNGFRIVADQADAAAVMFGVAAGEVEQAALSKWLRLHATATA